MIKNSSHSHNILLVSSHMSQANIEPFSNCVDILKEISDDLYVIVNYDINTTLNKYNNVHLFKVKYRFKKNTFKLFSLNGILIVINYLINQIKVSDCIVKCSKNVDICIFYLCDLQILPIFISKILNKKIMLVLGGSLKDAIEIHNYPLESVLFFVQKLNLNMMNRIVLYSPRLIKEWNFEKYVSKISIAHKHFIDFKTFSKTTEFNCRCNTIGYIGRLSKEKGIINFVYSIEKLIEINPNLNFLIIGDGDLKTDIETYLCKLNLLNYVNLLGWIDHKELPKYLNKIKFLVIPSYTEGLPNVMLEAMACETVIVTTPVGSIPEIIKDGETGFIMPDNSPKCIVENIIRAINHSDLGIVVSNAKSLVLNEFNYNVAVNGYRNAVLSMLKLSNES